MLAIYQFALCGETDVVAEEASHLPSAGDVCVFLEDGVLFSYHPFAERCPWLHVDGEDEKDLERVKSFARRVGGGAGRNEARELNKTAAFSLRVI